MRPHVIARPRTVHGVDFSGAVDAGRRIWIASGVVEGSTLRVEACRRAEGLPGSGRDRDPCLAALQKFVVEQHASAVGLDFPFGLPRALVKARSWEEFVRSFPGRYASPDKFRAACRHASDGVELRRVTDRESRTPFSPYNLRLYRQTYFGILELLHPLVRDRRACVLPMQKPLPDRPWVLEVCPASVLKRAGLYVPYKGGGEARRAARTRILRRLEETTPLSIPSSALRLEVANDSGGDALDSIVAAGATARALSNPASLTAQQDSIYALEGYVYV